eukprot:3875086-Pleurochrysis_carterae.AAC.1
MEEMRTLLDRWDEPFDDLPLTQRRRLHDQACKRRGLLHQALSDESFKPGADRVADIYVEVALDAYLPPRTTQKVLLRYTTHLPGPSCAVEVQPLFQLFEQFPELRTPVQTDLSAIH